MPSLPSLLAAHGSLLVVDAASLSVQVGLLRTGQAPLWRNSSEDAGTGLFRQTSTLLDAGAMTLEQIGALIFCAGPGSMLGIRTSAMALRTWQTLRSRPAYAYSSLTLAAHFARTQHPAEAFAVIADARRETWHCLAVGADGTSSEWQRLATADLPAVTLLTPEHFRRWSQPPRSLLTTSYELATIFATLAGEDYFQPSPSPNAFQATAPEYKKWSAQIHQATPAAS